MSQPHAVPLGAGTSQLHSRGLPRLTYPQQAAAPPAVIGFPGTSEDVEPETLPFALDTLEAELAAASSSPLSTPIGRAAPASTVAGASSSTALLLLS